MVVSNNTSSCVRYRNSFCRIKVIIRRQFVLFGNKIKQLCDKKNICGWYLLLISRRLVESLRNPSLLTPKNEDLYFIVRLLEVFRTEFFFIKFKLNAKFISRTFSETKIVKLKLSN